MKRAQEVLRHEIIGHYASLMLRDTVEWNGILRNIYRLEQMGNAKVLSAAALVDRNQKDLKDNPARRQEEIFAVLVERDEHNQIGVLRGLVDRILLRVKEWLQRLGMDNGWVNNRTFNEMMAWARQSEIGLASGKLVRGPWNAVGMSQELRDSIAAIAMLAKTDNGRPTAAELAQAQRQYDGVVAAKLAIENINKQIKKARFNKTKFARLRDSLPKGSAERAEADAKRKAAIQEENRLVLKTSKWSPYNIYMRTAGEIEARDTANRFDLTPDQRRETAPYLNTMFKDGIADSEVIVNTGRTGPALSEVRYSRTAATATDRRATKNLPPRRAKQLIATLGIAR